MQSNLTNSITGILKDKKLWILLFILAVGAILRLWQIQNLFSLGGDYDQAVYSLDARLLAQGYLPYSDFVLVHPPFYIIVLAAVYKIFGFSFGAGQYLAVVLSLASVIVLYMTGKKFYASRSGTNRRFLLCRISGHGLFRQAGGSGIAGDFPDYAGDLFPRGFSRKRKTIQAFSCRSDYWDWPLLQNIHFYRPR